jgi:hypothetical protein
VSLNLKSLLNLNYSFLERLPVPVPPPLQITQQTPAIIPSEEEPAVATSAANLTEQQSTDSPPAIEAPPFLLLKKPEKLQWKKKTVFLYELPPASSTITTTTSTTTESPGAAEIVGETHSQPQEEDQITSNLQKQSEKVSPVDETPSGESLAQL